MRTPPLLADFIHARVCKLKCEKFLTRPPRSESMDLITRKSPLILILPPDWHREIWRFTVKRMRFTVKRIHEEKTDFFLSLSIYLDISCTEVS